MNYNQWQYFQDFKSRFYNQIQKWLLYSQKLDLPKLQQQAAILDKVPPYSIENPIVYNTALEDISQQSDIRLIVIADNPGKEEQLNKNQKYLVGLAGKIASGYFQKNPQLNIDFRKNTIILNKTPIHSAKTKELNKIIQLAPQNHKKEIQDLITESQIWMAQETAKLHQIFVPSDCQLWLVGYSELKDKGLFQKYKKTLENEYLANQPTSELQISTPQFQKSWDSVLVFQHFSMNRFTIDLANNYQSDKSLQENLTYLGKKHKIDIGLKN